MTIVRKISLVLSHEDINFTGFVTLVYFAFFWSSLISSITYILALSVFLCTFKLQDQLTFKTFQEFHSFLLISLLTKIIFRLSQKNLLVVLDDFSFKLANNKQAKINFLKVVNYILLTFFDNLFDKCWLSTAQFNWKNLFFANKTWKRYI